MSPPNAEGRQPRSFQAPGARMGRIVAATCRLASSNCYRPPPSAVVGRPGRYARRGIVAWMIRSAPSADVKQDRNTKEINSADTLHFTASAGRPCCPVRSPNRLGGYALPGSCLLHSHGAGRFTGRQRDGFHLRSRRRSSGCSVGLRGQRAAGAALPRPRPPRLRLPTLTRARRSSTRTRSWTWRFCPSRGPVERRRGELSESGLFETIQKNYLYLPEATPDDPLYARQTYLSRVGVPEAWNTTTGRSDIVIAVVDTGVSPNHVDLSSKLLDGWNVYDGNSTFDDVLGHGTMVAGIAAASGDNAEGVSGVSWTSPILPVRVGNADGLSSGRHIAAGILWAAGQGSQGHQRELCAAVVGPDRHRPQRRRRSIAEAW